jgi:hypothetical protein
MEGAVTIGGGPGWLGPAEPAPRANSYHYHFMSTNLVLEETSDEFCEFLQNHTETTIAEGIACTFRSATAAWSHWREFHDSEVHAKEYIEQHRTKGVAWEIHPWPVVRLIADYKFPLLLTADDKSAIEELPAPFLIALQKRRSFPTWCLVDLLSQRTGFSLLHGTDGKLFRGEERYNWCLESSLSLTESRGSPLRWRKGSPYHVAKEVLKALTVRPTPRSVEDLILESLECDFPNDRLECSIIESATGRVILSRGRKITKGDLRTLASQENEVQALPTEAGADLLTVLRRFRRW